MWKLTTTTKRWRMTMKDWWKADETEHCAKRSELNVDIAMWRGHSAVVRLEWPRVFERKNARTGERPSYQKENDASGEKCFRAWIAKWSKAWYNLMDPLSFAVCYAFCDSGNSVADYILLKYSVWKRLTIWQPQHWILYKVQNMDFLAICFVRLV